MRCLDMYKVGGTGSGRGLVPQIESGVEAAEAVRLLGEFYMRSNPHAPRPKKRRMRA